MAWFSAILAAIDGGAPAVFNTADATRIPLLRQAVAGALQGRPVPLPASDVASGAGNQILILSGSALPTFQVNQQAFRVPKIAQLWVQQGAAVLARVSFG